MCNTKAVSNEVAVRVSTSQDYDVCKGNVLVHLGDGMVLQKAFGGGRGPCVFVSTAIEGAFSVEVNLEGYLPRTYTGYTVTKVRCGGRVTEEPMPGLILITAERDPAVPANYGYAHGGSGQAGGSSSGTSSGTSGSGGAGGAVASTPYCDGYCEANALCSQGPETRDECIRRCVVGGAALHACEAHRAYEDCTVEVPSQWGCASGTAVHQTCQKPGPTACPLSGVTPKRCEFDAATSSCVDEAKIDVCCSRAGVLYTVDGARACLVAKGDGAPAVVSCHTELLSCDAPEGSDCYVREVSGSVEVLLTSQRYGDLGEGQGFSPCGADTNKLTPCPP